MRCWPCHEEFLSETRFINHAARVHAVNRIKLAVLLEECPDSQATIVKTESGKVFCLLQAPLSLDPPKTAHSERSGPLNER